MSGEEFMSARDHDPGIGSSCGERPEFLSFPKMARLAREIIVTEKIDGTNAQVFIGEDGAVLAGSRSRWITPEDDNFGFARWVADHADELRELGPGRHFGEWWGAGIQRKYGLADKRFSLFNVSRWGNERPACCHVVPVLYRGMFDTSEIEDSLRRLRDFGSHAAPGFMKPEGVVVFHVAGNVGFKRTIEKDEEPKSLAAASCGSAEGVAPVQLRALPDKASPTGGEGS